MFELNRLQCGPVADFHVHPDYSIDGSGSLEEWCQAAFQVGLSEICFTPHFEVNPVRESSQAFMKIAGEKVIITDQAIKHYFDHVDRVYEEYGALGLLVRGGLEFGYYPGCEKIISEVKSKFNIYYSLAGLHDLDNLCFTESDDARRLFAKYKLAQFADKYFERLDNLVASGLINVLAHIDIYRRYGFKHYGKEVYTIHRGRIEKLFKTMLAHNVGYELNTSAIRHGFYEYYPCMEIINMARNAGVHLIALGSDAHRPEEIAHDFDAAAAIAYELFPYVDE